MEHAYTLCNETHEAYLQLLCSPLAGEAGVEGGKVPSLLPVPLPGQVASHSCLYPYRTSADIQYILSWDPIQAVGVTSCKLCWLQLFDVKRAVLPQLFVATRMRMAKSAPDGRRQ